MKQLEIKTFNLLCSEHAPHQLYQDVQDCISKDSSYQNVYKSMDDVIDKWLKEENSPRMKGFLFTEFLNLGINQFSYQMIRHIFKFSQPEFEDKHRDYCWKTLIHSVRNNVKTKNGQRHNSYQFTTILSTFLENTTVDLEYNEWKESIVNYALDNQKDEFLSILSLHDKKIFNSSQLPKILSRPESISYFYDNAFSKFKAPKKYNSLVQEIIKSSLLNMTDKENMIENTKKLISIYQEQIDLGSIFLPEIENIKEKKTYDIIKKNGFISLLYSNQLEHQLKPSSGNHIKIKL